MGEQFWTYLFVSLTFGIYILIAFWARASTTKEFYVAGHDVPPILNGMATAADWMSAASFLSMAGLIAFLGYGGSVYLMGWTGGYVLLALLLAPFLREFGKFTVPDFVGERYYSKLARVIAVVCALMVSFTYIAGQMKGVGVAFSSFLGVPFNVGIFIGGLIVFIYAVLGGMKGVTYTQVAQYVVLIFAYTVPAIFISIIVTNNPIPQLGFIGNIAGSDVPMLSKLNSVVTELGFKEYTSTTKSNVDIFCITAALMFGTAGLPHVIIRFFTVKSAKAARKSAGWALMFIALLYTVAPAVGAFARMNFIDTVNEATYIGNSENFEERRSEILSDGGKPIPGWYKDWEKTGLLDFNDLNQDGIIQYRGPDSKDNIKNEIVPNRDIFVLANPQIANLPHWVIGLVVAGGLAAALSTAAGLLMVISSAISHDLMKNTFYPNMSERSELLIARTSAFLAILLSAFIGAFASSLPFVAQVVAFAFGIAAASLFPVVVLGIFWKRMNKEGAIVSMLTGLITTVGYICYFKFMGGVEAGWWFGISPEGIGFIFMIVAVFTGMIVALLSPAPPIEIQKLVESIRIPGQRRT
ncbi:cation acetate symporter [Hellea sp.]|jgi:cation/acetate symporter|nr:sodium:solute symporter family protein [Hellea sp.]MBT3593519.1 cation acetate symporter [Hellea sp.]MBT7398872.1 cation acetate symporter [Hellea sp.]MDA8888532.1 cation acetate symporter [Hellea sp.]MDB4845058.1 cation acetate symporter [Hellea sp.]MDC0651287.1 cation acetate symporter [Hellea sp.]